MDAQERQTIAVDGPLAGQIIEAPPLRQMITVSLGSTRIRRVYGRTAVDVERHHGLATYRRDESGQWTHVQTPLAIGDAVDIAAGRQPTIEGGEP